MGKATGGHADCALARRAGLADGRASSIGSASGNRRRGPAWDAGLGLGGCVPLGLSPGEPRSPLSPQRHH